MILDVEVQLTKCFTDIDPFLCEWVSNLYPSDYVYQWDIKTTAPKSLFNHDRVHLFCGVGGWEIALSLATWPKEEQVWTVSCPCQPFSNAGNKLANNDDRHLWPHVYEYIKKYKPTTIFGEQVAGPLGRKWLSMVRLDLEALGYAVGCSDLPAASIGAYHIRQRLYFVADLNQKRWQNSTWGKRPRKRMPTATPIEYGIRKWLPEPKEGWVVNGVQAHPLAVGAYGNAIVPQIAAEFIMAYMEAKQL